MPRRLRRNLVLLVFLLLSVRTLQAWQYPDQLCQDWSCGTCNYEGIVLCEYGWGIYTSYSHSECEAWSERCADNEFTCMGWCYTLGPALDWCKQVGSGCYVTYPGGSSCDEEGGTMSCSCGYYNSCPPRERH